MCWVKRGERMIGKNTLGFLSLRCVRTKTLSNPDPHSKNQPQTLSEMFL